MCKVFVQLSVLYRCPFLMISIFCHQANTLAVTGEMLARQKLLKARGWAVISVPFFRWSGLSDAQRTDWFFPV